MTSDLASKKKLDLLLMCSNCPKKFETKNNLQKHSKRHTDKLLEPHFPCSQCAKLFRTRSLTHAHEKYVHGEKKFKCNQCERMFSTTRDFQNHDCNHKSRKFEYSCDQCGHKTVNKSKLNAHMRNVHNKNYNSYFCNICLKGFVRRFNLILHIKKFHPGDNDSLVNLKDSLPHNKDHTNVSNIFTEEQMHLLKTEEDSDNNEKEKIYILDTDNADLETKNMPGSLKLMKTFSEIRLPSEELDNNAQTPEENGGLDFKHDDLDTEKQQDGSSALIKETSEILEDANSVEDTKLELESPVSCIKNAISINNYLNLLSEEETHVEDSEKGYKEKDKENEDFDGDKNDVKVVSKVLRSQENFCKVETQDEIKEFIDVKLEENEESIKNIDFNKISISLSIRQSYLSDGEKDSENEYIKSENESLTDVNKAFNPFFDTSKLHLNNDLVYTLTETVTPDIKIDQEKQMKKEEKNNINFACPGCEQIFLSKPSLKVHQRLHTGEKPYQCEHCEKSFSHMSPYNSHKTTHTDERPYQCNICGKGSKIKQSYTNHMRLHQGDERYKCDECEKQCTTKQKLEVHKRLHSGEKPYVCDFCGKDFSQYDRLKVHVRVHTNEKPYACEMCSDTFSDSTKLKVHLRIHTGETPFQCTICMKSFFNAHNLKVHMRLHAKNKTYTCDFCGETFLIYKKLKLHKIPHYEYKCTICEKLFKKERGLMVHDTLEHSVRPAGLPLTCLECGKEFQKQNHLQKHNRRHALAASGSAFPCITCSKPFKSKELVKMHEKYVHGEKKLQCVNCLRRFHANRELRQHKCKTYL